MPAPTEDNIIMRQSQIDDMKLFLSTATQHWDTPKCIKRFYLPNGEAIGCVLWDNMFFISGTDIVRSLTFRFHAFGRPVSNPKKFEEGIFSDLRNLKPGHDARLEEPKSDLLDTLYKNNCIRTQKKQKVFYWFSVPHDRLFLDALERDLKREKMGLESTTQALVRPATLLTLNSTQELFDDLRKNMSKTVSAKDEPWMTRLEQNPPKRSRVSLPALDPKNRQRRSSTALSPPTAHARVQSGWSRHPSRSSSRSSVSSQSSNSSSHSPQEPASPFQTQFMHQDYLDPIASAVNQLEISNSKVLRTQSLDLKKQRALLGHLSLLDGSPGYKQRRRRTVSSTHTCSSSPSTSPGHARRHAHDRCHHPPPVKTNFSRVASFGSPPPLNKPDPKKPSRLALAASKAGYVAPKPVLPPLSPHYAPQQPLDYPSSELYPPTVPHNAQTIDIMDWQHPLDKTPPDFPSTHFLNGLKPDPMLSAMPIDLALKHDPFAVDPLLFSRHPDWPSLLTLNTIYDPILSATSSTHSRHRPFDDDLSSSTVSSPSDNFQSMTLFSPFKPLTEENESIHPLGFGDVHPYYASYITNDLNPFVFGSS
ncbi:STE like transcription factor-domain-containing protein [Sporodiniella umbellata]|nr:STE like transcription factor-domain-containing protein [Sporodiniella umbellata]